MNIPTNTFSNWKTRDQLNEKPIIAFCVQRDIDLNFIFTGEKMKTMTVQEPPESYNNDLLVQTLMKNVKLLEDRLARSEETLNRAREMEEKLMDAQRELLKVQAELLDSQKKLRAALDTISELKKKKAA